MRRSRMDIFYEILEFLVYEPKRSTHIIYKVNMSWVQFQSVISVMKNMNLVQEIRSPTGGRLFLLTDKGKQVNRYYRECMRLMTIDAISV